MKNFAICAIMKNTPDYILKEWINHHFNIGVDDIYIIIDIGSTPLYHDDRVHYVQLTREITENWPYFKYQSSAYRYVLKEIYNEYRWIICLDDDEFLQIDISLLDEYHDKYSSVLLPWNFKGYFSMFPEEDLSKYTDIILPFESKYMCRRVNCKPILNMSKISWRAIMNDHISVHIGFDYDDNFKMTVMGCNDGDGIEYIDNDDMSLRKDILLNPKKYGLYIDHYIFRSFLETVDRFFERGDVCKIGDSYFWGRRLYDYFEYYGITNLYNPKDMFNMLKEINKIEYANNKLYPFAIPDDNIKKKFSAIIMLSKNSNKDVFNNTIKNNIKNGINDIYVIYDIGNEIILDNLYPDKVHFYSITEDDLESIKIHSTNAVCIEKGLYQIGVYDWFYLKIKDKYDWVLLIDDDEYINTDIRFLWNYENVSAVYIPWKNFILPYNCNKYSPDLLEYRKFYPYQEWFYKSAINTKLTNMICTLHFGDCTGVNLNGKRLLIDYMFGKSYFVDNITDIVSLDEKSNIFIHHTFFTTFDALIDKVFYRKAPDSYFNNDYGMSIKVQLWYKLNNLIYDFLNFINDLRNNGYDNIADHVLNNSEMYKMNMLTRERCLSLNEE